MEFDEIIGNRKVKEFLCDMLQNNHILHSYLFVGIQGIGKTLIAKQFTKALLCYEKDSCQDTCPSCIKWNSLNHPDFQMIESEGNIIKIEQIRKMQETIAQKPIISKRKVYIIQDAEYMTKEAQNCLLKTLEEPPEYTVIILVTANESKLLNTIKSRCMKIPFSSLKVQELEAYCKKEKIELLSPTFLEMSEGSIGKLLLLQENAEIYGQVNSILDNMDKHDLITTFQKAEILYKQKEKIQEILEYMNIYLYHTKEMRKLNCIKYVEDTKARLLANSNYDMCIDYLLMKMWEEINEKYSRSAI